MSCLVNVVRTLGDTRLSRTWHFPLAPAPGMVVALPEGVDVVVGRVRVALRELRPGVYPPSVTVETLAEPGDALEAARAAGWSEPASGASA